MRYRVAYVVDGRTQYTGSFSTKRAADAAKARLHLTYALVRVETMPEATPWKSLLTGKGVEHVTVWTVDGCHQHKTVQS